MKSDCIYGIFAFLITFSIITGIVAPIFTKRTLAQPSGQIIIDETVYWENDFGRLEVTPPFHEGLIEHVQNFNITWNQSDTNIDIAFRFDEPLQGKKDIWLWQNTSHQVAIDDYDWTTSDYTLYNILDIATINESEANESGVVFGDIPSTYYRRGNASYYNVVDEDYVELIDASIGFDSFHWLNVEQTNATFNYTYWGKVSEHYETQYWFEYVSKKHLFNHTTYNNKEYYFIKNVSVIQNSSYLGKWLYSQPMGTTGKWDLLVKFSNETLEYALENDRYIMIDPWWNSSWFNRRTITIESDYIDATLDNLPVLIVIDNTSGGYCLDNGNSIRFVNSLNDTEFPYEIERLNEAGETFCWVNISEAIQSGTDFQFNLYYNNSGASDAQNANGVWNSDYVAVWHMNGSSATDIYDSTGNGHDGTTDVGSPTYQVDVDGTIGYCVNFSGGAYISVPDHVDFSFATGGAGSRTDQPVTFDLWVKFHESACANAAPISKWGVDAANDAEWLMTRNLSCNERFYLRDTSGDDNIYRYTSSSVVGDNISWHGLAGGYDGSEDENNIDTYINGTLDNGLAQKDGTYDGMEDEPSPVWIGAYHSTVIGWIGYIDEIRISDIERNASWIKATFHSNNRTTGFITIGAEEQNISVNTSVDTITPYWQDAVSTLIINASNITGNPDNVTLWYRWSFDNESWEGGVWSWNNDSVDDNTIDIDGNADVGVETDFAYCQDIVPDDDNMTLAEVDQGGAGFSENLNVDSLDNTSLDWDDEIGTYPYLDVDDDASYIFETTSDLDDEQWFGFANTSETGSGFTTVLYVDFDAGDGDDDCNWFIDTSGDDVAEVSGTFVNPTTGVETTGTISELDTATEINDARLWLQYDSTGGKGDMIVDHAYFNISKAGSNDYELDREYGWTGITNYSSDTELLCFYVNSTVTENLTVDYWSGSAWSELGDIESVGWTNFTATGLSNSSYWIHIYDENQTDEATNHSWDIDAMFLQTYNTSNGPYGYNWTNWINTSNPDTVYPWQWTFDFPNGTGYYEFYSIGNLSGTPESAPTVADAICHVNYSEPVEAWNIIQSGWFNFQNTSAHYIVESGWFNFANTSAFSTVQSGWFNFANDTDFVPVQSGWFSFSNASTYEIVQSGWFDFNNVSAFSIIQSGWFSFSHTATNQTVQSGWFDFSNVSAYNVIQSGWFSFSNASSYGIVQSGWFDFQNTSTHQIVQSGWFNFQNVSAYSIVQSGWFSFSNTSTHNTVQSGWFVFENTSIRGWMDVQTGWFDFSNVSAFSTVQSGWFDFSNTSEYSTIQSGWFNFQNSTSYVTVQSGWFSFSNTSTHNIVQSGWFVFENTSERGWADVQPGWFNFANDSSHNVVQSGWFNFLNTSVANWTDVQTGWFSFSNITTNRIVQSGWFSFANVSQMLVVQSGWFNFNNVSSHQLFQSGWFDFSNIQSNQTVQSGWFSFSNTSAFTIIQSGWFSFENTTVVNLTITNPSPPDDAVINFNSNGIETCVTITTSSTYNITFYWNESGVWTVYAHEINSTGSGEICYTNTNFSDSYQEYQWSVNVTGSNETVNNSYHFHTIIDGSIDRYSEPIGLTALVLALFCFMLIRRMLKKRRKR